jgi:lysyl-tRNA synthetase class 2
MQKDSKNSLREERINKLKNFKEKGIDPYPAGPFKKEDIEKVLAKKIGEKVKIAGRIMLFREMGKITFLHLKDETGKMQVVFNKNELKDDYKFWIKNLDIGDFIGISGERFDTKKEEKSVLAKEITLLTKSIKPLPDKHKALTNEEAKLRKRYLDILFNKEIQDLVYKKEKFWSSIREFMKKKGFVEVETPVLETVPGGADAKPFITYHNALGIEVYLRISMGELWQKRLMAAGLEKTFEIGRQFRNEGMSPEHLQDYTQMEFYLAYANYKEGMELVKELYRHMAKATFGTLNFKIKNFEVDLAKEWEIYDYQSVVKKETGIDVLNTNLDEIEKKLKELKVEYDKKGFNITRGIDNLWKYCRKKIAGPGFLVNLPLEVSPLAKKKKGNPRLVERFQPIIAGSELGNGYSELNDPIDQAERFKEQQELRDAGDEEAQMHDSDFVEVLEYGMPPTCGFGMSERVFSFLMNKTARECQIFPLMKPKNSVNQTNASSNNQALGIDYKQALKLVDKYIKDPITKLHLIETEVIMRDLAKKFKEDEEKWAIIGLLHDIDWEKTKDDTKEHCVLAKEILKKEGASDFLIKTIQSHAYQGERDDKFYGADEFKNKDREGLLEYALAAAETVTGLIVASALVLPDKKLKSLKLKSLKKKFKSKSFAANCNREMILECEKMGLSLDEFLELSLKSLQSIDKKLGL